MQTIRNLLICQIITSIFAEDILRQIDVKTGDCEDCGMSQFGDISIKVTSIHHPKFTKNWVLSTFQLCGSGPLACCITGDLDNAFENDFNQGSLSSFSGNNLGECNGFDMGDGPIDMSQIMTIYHSGN